MIKATALAILFPCSAIAQCLPHADVVAALAEEYGETRRSIALSADGAMVETFAAESGSWTITVTTPGGPTCLVAAGQAWQAVSEALPIPGEDT